MHTYEEAGQLLNLQHRHILLLPFASDRVFIHDRGTQGQFRYQDLCLQEIEILLICLANTLGLPSHLGSWDYTCICLKVRFANSTYETT